MRRDIIIFLILFLADSDFLLAQNSDRLLTIQGQLFNHKGETLRGEGTVQLIGKGNMVKRATRVDIEGNFEFRICPNQLLEDTLRFRIAALGYEVEIIDRKISSDTIQIRLTKPESAIDLKTYKKIDFNMLAAYECGTGYFDEHMYFENCKGERRKGTELKQINADVLEWTPIEK